MLLKYKNDCVRLRFVSLCVFLDGLKKGSQLFVDGIFSESMESVRNICITSLHFKSLEALHPLVWVGFY